MLNFLKNIFRQNTSMNPKFQILKKTFPKDFNFREVSSIYFLGSISYSEELIEKSKQLINKNELSKIFDTTSFDTNRDSLDFYLIKKDNKSQLIIIFFDCYDPMDNEYIIDMISLKKELLESNFNDFEEIYSR